MIEKDNIQELFSKAFENHTSSVRPDLWSGVQAKMSAAGVTSGSVAVKGISALTKWIVGTAAVTTVGVTAYIVTNNPTNPETKEQPAIVASTNNAVSETPIQNKDVEANPKTNMGLENANSSQQQFSPSRSSNEQRIFNFTPSESELLTQDFPVVSPVEKSNPVTPVFVEKQFQQNNQSTAAVKDNNSSAGSASSTTNVEDNNTAKVAEAQLELPNIFTPNGDRANDLCQFVKVENVKTVDITIMDQDNKTIFRSDDINFAWDGTLASGDQARVGIYTVLISYTDLADKAKTKKAFVYLQR